MPDAPPERQPTLAEMDDDTIVTTARLTASVMHSLGEDPSHETTCDLLHEMANRVEDAM